MTISLSKHCSKCGSENILMLNANVKWDIDKQEWQFVECHDTVYLCVACNYEHIDCTEKEIQWARLKYI